MTKKNLPSKPVPLDWVIGSKEDFEKLPEPIKRDIEESIEPLLKKQHD